MKGYLSILKAINETRVKLNKLQKTAKDVCMHLSASKKNKKRKTILKSNTSFKTKTTNTNSNTRFKSSGLFSKPLNKPLSVRNSLSVPNMSNPIINAAPIYDKPLSFSSNSTSTLSSSVKPLNFANANSVNSKPFATVSPSVPPFSVTPSTSVPSSNAPSTLSPLNSISITPDPSPINFTKNSNKKSNNNSNKKSNNKLFNSKNKTKNNINKLNSTKKTNSIF